MAWSSPPPLNSTDISSPSWRDWFFKLTKQISKSDPESDQVVMSGKVFANRQDPIRPTSIATNSEVMGAVRAFGAKGNVERVEMAAADTSTVLAGQIFGG